MLLDDGKIRLEVTEGDDFANTIANGGPLSGRKGVNVPNAVLPLSALTQKDREDLAFALDMGADWSRLCVQRAEDVAEAHADRRASGCPGQAGETGRDRPVESIVEISDAVMVARGDLGELPPERVPPLQRIIRLCRRPGKPVVVATQMLGSMVQSPAPAGAASDVAAVYDSADAVMLSAESAAGKFPVEAVQMMDRIIATSRATGST